MNRRAWYLVVAVLIAALAFFGVRAFSPEPRESTYTFLQAWGRPGNGVGELQEPIGIAVAGNEVFVSDAGNNRIQVFDRQGHYLRHFGQDLARPMHLDIRHGKLCVAEYLDDRVQIFSLQGEPVGIIGSSGTGPGEFDAPGGVAVDSDGRLYIADFYNHRVQVLESTGQFVRQYGVTGKKGIAAGHFNYPTDVAVSEDGNLIVAEEREGKSS